MTNDIRERLIRSGVNDLGKFGYPGVRPENILTDPLYSAFFKSNLENALVDLQGVSGERAATLRAEIEKLILECAGLGD